MSNLKPMANQRKAPRRRILKSGTIILGKKARDALLLRDKSEKCSVNQLEKCKSEKADPSNGDDHNRA